MPVALAPFLRALGALGFARGSVQAWSRKMSFCVTAIAPWPSLLVIPGLWSRACFASFLLLLFLCLQCDQPAVWRAGTLSSAKTSFWLTRELACCAGALSACVGRARLCAGLRASLVTQNVLLRDGNSPVALSLGHPRLMVASLLCFISVAPLPLSSVRPTCRLWRGRPVTGSSARDWTTPGGPRTTPSRA